MKYIILKHSSIKIFLFVLFLCGTAYTGTNDPLKAGIALTKEISEKFMPADTCPKYKVYTKKVVTSSSRGQISNTGWVLKKEIQTCETVSKEEVSTGYDTRYINQPENNDEVITTEIFEKYESNECKASKNTKELKMSFGLIDETIESVEKLANKVPKLEIKLSVKPNLTVKKGEECCTKDKPPVQYTELKGGVEVQCEILFNLFGLPDVNESIKLWPFLLIIKLQNKVYAGPYGKGDIEGVGRFYGELGDKQSYPECKSCFYLNFKYEGGVKLGIKLGGKIALYHWSPLSKGKAGFDVTGEPDEEIKAEADAGVTFGVEIRGTYANDICVKPKPGLHGKVAIGSAKAALKFSLKLGPLSFNPKYEIPLMDGIGFEW